MPLFYEYKDSYHEAILKVWRMEEDEDFTTIACPSNIVHPIRKQQYMAARYTLLQCDPNFPLDQITLDETGKPFVPNYNVSFSLSHSGHYAAALVAKVGHSGVDIELPGKKLSAIKNKFLSHEEYQQLRPTLKSFFPTAPEFVLYGLCWSAKESAYKAVGKRGLDFKEQIQLYPLKYQLEIDKAIIGCSVKIDEETESSQIHIYLKWEKPLVITWALLT
ncbi:MAG: 4'-phosphopantetheinyl transferase family protein [Chitinophagaceae bacterium]